MTVDVHGQLDGTWRGSPWVNSDVQGLERPAAWSAQGHGDDRQQEAASGGRATTRRSCSGSCKWWTDAGSVKASGAREKEPGYPGLGTLSSSLWMIVLQQDDWALSSGSQPPTTHAGTSGSAAT